MAHTDHIGYVSYADLQTEYAWLLGEQQDALDADDIERHKEADRRLATTEAQMADTKARIAGLARRIAELLLDLEEYRFAPYLGGDEEERMMQTQEELAHLRAELQQLSGDVPF